MSFRLLIGTILVVVGLAGEPLWEAAKNINWPTPETPVTVVEPSMELKTLVQQLMICVN